MFANKLVKVFYCCSDSAKDEEMRQQLEDHLTNLQRYRVIEGWHRGMISPGKEWKSETDNNLKSADIILLLISSKFNASDYHWDILAKQAMEQHRQQISRVIIILLRPVDDYWKIAFPKVKVLPDGERPITEWRPYDKAFKNIADGIREVAKEVSDPTYHTKKSLRQVGTAIIPIAKNTGNTFIEVAKVTLSYLLKPSRSRRSRRLSKIPIRPLLVLSSGIFLLFFIQSLNILQMSSSEVSGTARSEPCPILSSTQIRKSTGWIRIGKVSSTSGSLTDGQPLLETSISSSVIPSPGSVVTVKYEVDLRKEKSPLSEFLQKLKPGETVKVFNVKSIAKSSQNSPSIEVMAEVRKFNCKQ
ncbi:TIR domain-containing protein [Dendronalium sp. ChiSLP03b]|uniref:TIR domain-containing protein n=1 Tax=Dendronalium sp. ChiSLP03b TaxID=3075381 RepID=UPI002AD3CCAB|nr:TIR domain-containing protein [Dendronalium sp. ChiSLP03b]MDZ8208187.1 TIR domain-containing protein [Dendronalium sp. ChiSLP03b]